MVLSFNLLITSLFFIITYLLLKKELGIFLLSFVIIIQYLWMSCSISFIETGVFINEQGRNGFFVYSNFYLLFFFISTVFGLVFFNKFFDKLLKNFKVTYFKFLKFNDMYLLKVLLITVLFLAYFNLISSPIPFFSNYVTKFNFWTYAKYPFLKSVIGNVMAFVPFGAALLFKYWKKTSISILILYLIYLFLVGQKFTGFFFGSNAVLIAFYYTSSKKILFKPIWVFNKYLIFSIILLFSLVLYKYELRNPFKYLGLTPFEAIFYRTFGLQGHVFWGVSEKYIFNSHPNTWDVSELWKGMRHLMLEFWPWDKNAYISVTSRGVNWTNAYPSILVRIFPFWLSLLINFFLTSFISIIQVFLKIFIRRSAYLMSLVFFQSLIWVIYSFTMGYFYKLVIPTVILLIYFSYKYVKYKSFKR